MANQHLQGKEYNIPKNTHILLKNALASFEQNGGNKGLKGYTLLKNLVSSGKLSYENLKNIKNDFDSGSFPQEILNLKGMADLRKNIEDTLKLERTNVNIKKDVKSKTGVENSHIKSHNKDTTKNSQVATSIERNPFSLSENVKKKVLLITEEQHKVLMENVNDVGNILIDKILTPLFGEPRYIESDWGEVFIFDHPEIKLAFIYNEWKKDFWFEVGQETFYIDSIEKDSYKKLLMSIWKNAIYLEDFPQLSKGEFDNLEELANNGNVELAFQILVGIVEENK